MPDKPHIRRVAPYVTEFVFEPMVSPEVHDRVLALAAAIRTWASEGVEEVILGYHSVGVRMSPEAAARLNADWRRHIDGWDPSGFRPSHRTVTVPVMFDGQDLDAIGKHAGMAVDDVVRLFCSVTYRVYMNGFIGGFPYLASVPEALRLPRRDSPRPHVKAGSVAIAGEQAGIYHADSPGGWNLIGRVTCQLDDLRLEPGDHVRFEEIRP